VARRQSQSSTRESVERTETGRAWDSVNHDCCFSSEPSKLSTVVMSERGVWADPTLSSASASKTSPVVAQGIEGDGGRAESTPAAESEKSARGDASEEPNAGVYVVDSGARQSPEVNEGEGEPKPADAFAKTVVVT
jgi:hypothetical protein